jgi:predicted permease
MRVFKLLYRAVLGLTPREFRDRHGADALAMACARIGEDTGPRRAARAVRELVDLALAVPALRRQSARDEGRGRYGWASAISALAFEMRQALRALRRSTRTTATAVLVLGLSIGMATAVFSVADRVLFKPLPYPAPDRLVELLFTTPTFRVSLSGAEFAGARAATNVFEQVEGYDPRRSATRLDGREPHRVQVAHVTPGFLSLLAARVIGEPFSAAHAAGDGSPVAILAHEYWATRMGADPAVIGGLMHLEGEPPLRILGVLDRNFAFPAASRTALPHVLRPLSDNQLGNAGRSARGLARLREGVTPAAVSAAVPIDPAIRARGEFAVRAQPLEEVLVYKARRGLAMLFAGVVVLLAVGVLNVAGLLLVQAASREREIATRRALGAGTPRIARQLLLEGLLLAALSGGLGVVVARLASDGLMRLVPPELQILQAAGIDTRALLFAGGAVLVSALVFGLAPLLHAGRAPSSVMRAGAGQTQGRSVRRLAGAMVTAQIAGAVAVAVVGALLIVSFARVMRTPVGFDAGRLAYVSVSLPRTMRAAAAGFYEEALRRVRTIPGVETAALIDLPAMRGTIRGNTLGPDSGPVPASDRPMSDTQLVITPEYFRTAGLDIIDGRAFTDADAPNASTLAIVNQTLARSWFPNGRAVGRRLVSPMESRTIIGVVEDARHFRLKEEPLAEIFLPMNPAQPMLSATFVVRAADPDAVIAGVVAAVRSLAPTLPIADVETGAAAVSRAAGAERFYAVLISVITATGLVLAAVGLFGVLSWSVASRRRELALRAALGADPARLAGAIAREAVPLILVGALAGVITGSWGARFARSLLYEVGPSDPEIWIGVAAVIVLAVTLAIAGPSRRALKTSPADALRE